MQLLFKTPVWPATTFPRMTTLLIPTKPRFLRATTICLLLIGCGGSAGSTVITDPGGINTTNSPIAGTYQTAVSLTSSSCTGITVQNNPTTVAHTAGATTLTLTHVGISYSGTLAANNSFTTTAKPIEAGAVTHTLTIAGQFTTNGFTADVTANVTGSGNGAPCQYVVRWVGSK